MLPRESNYFDHQDEHWVTNPFIGDRQKIRMFEDMLALSKKVGTLTERKRILDVIKKQIKECRESDNPMDKSFIGGLQLIEGMVNDDIDRLKG